MTVRQDLTDIYRRRRFACLFFSLLVSLGSAPLLAAWGLSTKIMEVVLLVNILAAVFITLFSFRSYLGLGLLVLVLAGRAGKTLLGYDTLLMTSQGAAALICLASAVIMLRYILGKGSVTSERIFAALNVYLMLGIMCGLLFSIFEEEWPGSLSFQGSSPTATTRIQLAHAVYFSFVTLGTLGYGDIIPVGGPARALAVAEAIGGQMYLVVVVARLVSLYQGSADWNDGNERDKAVNIDGDPQS